MNFKRLTLGAGAMLAAIVISAAGAQAQTHASARASAGTAARMSAPASSQRFARPSGNWNNDHRWHHRHPHYYGFYPYGYGFYPYGWGYGYPYYGASAALYYNGYGNGQVYESRPSGGGSVVAEVQQELARAGYYRGAVDGVLGDRTRNAIRAYERRNGLRVNGRVDGELLASMGLN
ncbi:MAG: peptidoglycan-binding protein [Verrucomicrobiota bacterium]|nr:peptidoglycan-binding protein [Verrucomicrobiota bacterium]